MQAAASDRHRGFWEWALSDLGRRAVIGERSPEQYLVDASEVQATLSGACADEPTGRYLGDWRWWRAHLDADGSPPAPYLALPSPSCMPAFLRVKALERKAAILHKLTGKDSAGLLDELHRRALASPLP